MLVYVLDWLVSGYIADLNPKFWQYLSYWTEFILMVYFMYAFGVSVYAFKTTNGSEKDKDEDGKQNNVLKNQFFYYFHCNSPKCVTSLEPFVIAPRQHSSFRSCSGDKPLAMLCPI